LRSDNQRPIVTTVIPVFNGERYLADAIGSVLAQSYPALECVVIDDGSTDRSQTLARSFPGVRCISKTNGGVSSARNVGIEAATGDLVAFLDADDTWLPRKIECQIAMMDTRPDLAMSYTGLQVVDEELRPIGMMHAPPGDLALRNSLLMEPPVVSVAQTGLARRGVLEQVGGFDERMTTSADTDLACRIALAYSVDGVDEALALYRQHAGQMHHDADAMERDMNLLFEKMFVSGPPPIKSWERRARANLETTLGLARLHERKIGRGVSHIARSLRSDPTSFLRAINRRTDRGR